MINPLEPRDAFYGGRTEAFTLFQKDQDISYVDATSLYPYINKTGKIPIGHHEIVTEDFTDIQQYEGLIKCIYCLSLTFLLRSYSIVKY